MGQKSNSPSRDISAVGFLWRFLAALALVLLTYNPSGFSAYHWVSSAFAASEFGPLHLLLIGVLLAGWAIFWIATWRSLDTLGVVLASVILGAIVWLLIDLGVLTASSWSSAVWIGLIFLAMILTIGVTWSHIWRRMTGQVTIEGDD